VELGTLVGSTENPPVPGAALVAGSGRIAGRPALVEAKVLTLLGGSIGSGSGEKCHRLCPAASQERVPLVTVGKGAGHRVVETVTGRQPGDLMGLAKLSGRVPLVSLVCGAPAGHGTLTVPLSDFMAMTESASTFAANPPLVRSATGEDVTKEELGGPSVAVDSGGVVHNVVADDRAAIALAQRYLAHFPLNTWDAPHRRKNGLDAGRRRVDLLPLIPSDPRRPYAIRPALEPLVEGGELLDVQSTFGPSIVTALAHLGGRNVAIVANDPNVLAGAIDCAAADKAAHFLDVADAFGLPRLFLADNPGVLAGTAADGEGMLPHAARLFAVQHRMRGPNST
jgi:acetyl-CoA carboxylase carboxyltransferase component